MNYNYFNPNPNAKTFKSGKPKAWNQQDDVVRSICKALNKSWIESYELLDNIAKKNYTMINDKNVVNELLSSCGFEYQTYGKPKIGEKRPVIEEFINAHQDGLYVLYLRDYYVTVINGVVYDTKMLDNEAIYSYWKL